MKESKNNRNEGKDLNFFLFIKEKEDVGKLQLFLCHPPFLDVTFKNSASYQTALKIPTMI
jgi:hypothetical protein